VVTFDWNGAAEGVAWELVPSVENAILPLANWILLYPKLLDSIKSGKREF
jgi:hypothetical protein